VFFQDQWVAKAPAYLRSKSFARVALVLGVVAVVAAALIINYAVAPSIGDHQDLLGRLANLEALRRSGNIYVPFGSEAFTYPPGAILLFWPIQWVPASLLTISWALVSLGALVATLAIVLARFVYLGRVLTWAIACWVTALTALIFPPILEGLTWGQTGTILLALVVLDFLVVRGASKGVLVGLATAFKIYPGLFIIAWLVRREWRAAFTALATTVGTTALAWVLWPTSARTFFSKEVFGGHELGHFSSHAAATASSSASALFMRAPFHVGLLDDYGTFGVCLLMMVVGLWSAHRLWRQGRELSALLVLLVAATIGAPLAWDHYFSFAPLLLFVPFEYSLRNPFSRVALVSAAVMVVPWFRFRRPTSSTWWTTTYAFIGRNALLFASLALVVTPFFAGPSSRVVACPACQEEESRSFSRFSRSLPASWFSGDRRRHQRRRVCPHQPAG
jgi:Glycosyltransferase family 87